MTMLIAGCTPAPPRAQPDITFADRPPIRLNVARIDVVQRYQPTLSDPYVEHLFDTPPSDAIRQWANDRLSARGATGTATLIIQDASVAEEQLARDPGLRGLVTIEQSERYAARFAVRLEVNDGAGRTGSADVVAERTNTVPENASLSKREEVWFDLTEKTVRDLDARFEQEITRGLPQFLVR